MKEADDQLYESKNVNVNHPQHYQSKYGIEVIDVIEVYTSNLLGIKATDTANMIKYACRWHKKNGIEDLEKILWYASHLLSKLKGFSRMRFEMQYLTTVLQMECITNAFTIETDNIVLKELSAKVIVLCCTWKNEDDIILIIRKVNDLINEVKRDK